MSGCHVVGACVFCEGQQNGGMMLLEPEGKIRESGEWNAYVEYLNYSHVLRFAIGGKRTPIVLS